MSFTLPRPLALAVAVVTAAVAWPGAARAQPETTTNGDLTEVNENPHHYRFNLDLLGGYHFFNDSHSLGRSPGDPTTLSPKDALAPTLDEAKAAGLLPEYEACRRLYATLAGSTP